MRVHSDQTEFCVSYDFLIASSRAPIVKAPLHNDSASLQYLSKSSLNGSSLLSGFQFDIHLLPGIMHNSDYIGKCNAHLPATAL